MASDLELGECQLHPSSPLLESKIEKLEGCDVPEEQLQEVMSEARPSRASPVPGSANNNEGYSELDNAVKSNSASSELINSPTTPNQTDSLSDDTGFQLDTADEKDEVSSTVSNLSDITGMSVLSEDSVVSSWVQKQIQIGTNPRTVLKLLSANAALVTEGLDDITLWKHVIDLMSEPPKRKKLPFVNTLQDVVELIKKSNKIIVLTGAGVSVSCGIPDFRSRDGIYSRLAQDFPDLPDPQAMFDINYFSQDPRPFYKFAREIYPGQFKPSPCHRFIKMLENENKLLRNYSQNIDTLERVAGIKNLIECHGSFATASCTKCKYQVNSDVVKEKILAQIIPLCPKCHDESIPSMAQSNIDENYRDLVAQGVMKPDIVFFGEGLPDAFHDAMTTDMEVCDLLIVIGSSLKVRPVALIPSSIPHSAPQILINRETIPHLEFDVELLGDGDVVINQLCHMLDGNFKEVCWRDTVLEEATSLLPCVTDSWDQSQDTSTNQDYSQDSDANIERDSFSLGSTSKKELRIFSQDEPDESEDYGGRQWKKFKNDSDFKELEDESSSCTRFYSNFVGNNSEKRNTHIPCQELVIKNIPSIRNNGNNGGSNSNSPINIEHHKKEKLSENEFLIKNEECTSLSNNPECAESSAKDFEFIAKDQERQLDELNFDENLMLARQEDITGLESGTNLINENACLNEGKSPTTSYESSRTAEEMFASSDDCQVVPRIDCLRDESTLEGNMDPCKSSDRSDLKPRHGSIDSVMDSALGDSCSSTECRKKKDDVDNDNENKKSHKSNTHLWEPIERESLASRLPENTYYQMKPGRYIFPGAEIYTNFPWNEGVLQVGGLRSGLTTTQLREH